jgi:ABC-type nickel/cobalt efflux system permease component RcnA
VALGLIAGLVVPGLVAAHPLGNFTINHYAGIRVEPDRILLDVVIDHAEIPAFQARLTFDTDGDGEVSPMETDAGRVAACEGLAGSLDLRVDDAPLALTVTEAGLTFPPGAGGLSTMRSVCGFAAAPDAPLQAGSSVTFVDRSFRERLGWREIVVAASGMTLEPSGEGTFRTTSPSDRLTTYPAELLAETLADTAIALRVQPGGPILPTPDLPDAEAVAIGADGADGEAASDAGVGSVEAATAGDGVDPVSAVVPGGVGAGDLPSIFRATDLTPLVLLVSILTATALGAGHALTPGHGKTLMAAYLVGTRGTPVHAAGLGLSVALSHTLGILALAGLVVGAQGVLPPDVVVRTAPVVAAVSIVAIGGWMLTGEARRRWSGRREQIDPGHGHHHPHDHEHDHHHDETPGQHTHGGRRHSHLPLPGSTISWRSLFVLGLAGGLIPSASALLILLGAVAAGRPAFGFILVVAFGLGMAAVMSGIGLALVIARARLDRVDTSTWPGRATAHLPLLASCLVLGFGIYLTIQAISASPVS